MSLFCHPFDDLDQYVRWQSVRRCTVCHEQTEANIRAKHIREGITNFTNCVSCHKSAHGEATVGGGREGGERSKHKKNDD